MLRYRSWIYCFLLLALWKKKGKSYHIYGIFSVQLFCWNEEVETSFSFCSSVLTCAVILALDSFLYLFAWSECGIFSLSISKTTCCVASFSCFFCVRTQVRTFLLVKCNNRIQISDILLIVNWFICASCSEIHDYRFPCYKWNPCFYL